MNNKKIIILLIILIRIIINVNAQDSVIGKWKLFKCYSGNIEVTDTNSIFKSCLFLNISDTNSSILIKGYANADSYYGIYSNFDSLLKPIRLIDANALNFEIKNKQFVLFLKLVSKPFIYKLIKDTLYFSDNNYRMLFVKPFVYEINMLNISSSTINDLESRNKDNLEIIDYIKNKPKINYQIYNVTVLDTNKFKMETKILSEDELINWIDKRNKRLKKKDSNNSMELYFQFTEEDEIENVRIKIKLLRNITQIDKFIEVHFN